jgi:hypothetical protein
MVSLVSCRPVRSKLGPMFDLNDEFEVNGLWRYSGQPGLYFMAVSTCSMLLPGNLGNEIYTSIHRPISHCSR